MDIEICKLSDHALVIAENDFTTLLREALY
jgi:hypothetical protein